MAVETKQRTGGWVLVAILAVVLIALMTQHALAEGVGRLLADLWISVVAVVLKLFASIFGGH
ncbi:MAG: hypothetical protein QM759_08365 [Terricaulis sp.]